MTQEGTTASALRRRRRRHPRMIRTPDGIEEIIPGLSTWTAEDLMEAGAWDAEFAEIAGVEDEYAEIEGIDDEYGPESMELDEEDDE